MGEFDSLQRMQDAGVIELVFWCVSGRCTNRREIRVKALLERYGGSTTLLMLARRFRCTVCGNHGAHVQPERPLSRGMGTGEDQEIGWP